MRRNHSSFIVMRPARILCMLVRRTWVIIRRAALTVIGFEKMDGNCEGFVVYSDRASGLYIYIYNSRLPCIKMVDNTCGLMSFLDFQIRDIYFELCY